MKKTITTFFFLLFTVFFSYGQVWKEFLFTEEMEEKYAERSDTSMIDTVHVSHITYLEEIEETSDTSKIDTTIVPNWTAFQQDLSVNKPNFSIPHKRFVYYPAFLMVFPKNDFTDNSLPIAIKEIRTKNDNTSFYLPKGEYIFLFLYRDREVYHTLNVNITK